MTKDWSTKVYQGKWKKTKKKKIEIKHVIQTVSNWILKECYQELANIIHRLIIITSLKKGVVSRDWKKEWILFLFTKEKIKISVTNRPVPLTSIVAKICEGHTKEMRKMKNNLLHVLVQWASGSDWLASAQLAWARLGSAPAD